jgi:hypothetical protein
MASVLLKPGKGDFVRKALPGGGDEELCLCAWNADFSEQGCINQVFVKHLQEVIDNHGGYAKGNFDNYRQRGEVNGRCCYCYGMRKNGGKVTAKTVDEKTIRDFKRKKPRYVRLGKLTECGHPYYYQTLVAFLELCKEFGTAVIFPTKDLPFGIEGAQDTRRYTKNEDTTVARLAESVRMAAGRDLAQILIGAKTSLHYSFGYDRLEPGAVSQGFTSKWRLEQALQYHQCEVNVSLTVVCDVTQSFDGNADVGSSIKEALRAKEKSGINVRILPLRPNSELVAQFIRGVPFGSLTNNGYHQTMPLGLDLGLGRAEIQYCQAPFRLRANNSAAPSYFHPDFKNLVDGGIGVCGAVGNTEYCDLCNTNTCLGKRICLPLNEIARLVFKERVPKRPNAARRALRDHPHFELEFK